MSRRRKSQRLPANPYPSEAALCAHFSERAGDCGWTVYPEVAGWDLILAVSGDDPVTIGVQAKLRRSWQLLAQASDPRAIRGPDFRAILVPAVGGDGYERVARSLRIEVFSMDRLVWRDIVRPDESIRWKGWKGLELPSVPGVGRAGTPAPIQLTPWRERAIVLCYLLRTRGWISGHDFERLGVSRTNWMSESWIVPDEIIRWHTLNGTRRQRYVIGCPEDILPDARYSPDVRSAVFAAWAAREAWLATPITTPDRSPA